MPAAKRTRETDPRTGVPGAAEIVRRVSESVIGQTEAKRALATSLRRHLLSTLSGTDFGKQVLLIVGPSGSGKTALVESTAAALRYLGIDCVVSVHDSSALVGAGYVGAQTDSIFRSHFMAADGQKDRAESGVVVFDEIDKKAVADVGGQRDVSGRDVQTGLLKLIEGATIGFRVGEDHVQLNTKRMMFVLAGAFTGLRDIIRDRIEGPRCFGFQSNSTRAGREENGDLLALAEPVDLVNFGMIPELVGRISSWTYTTDLSEVDLVQILRSSSGSTIERLKSYFKAHGVVLDVTDCALQALARKAAACGTGARGLARALSAALSDLEYELPLLAESCRRIVINDRFVRGDGAPIFINEP